MKLFSKTLIALVVAIGCNNLSTTTAKALTPAFPTQDLPDTTRTAILEQAIIDSDTPPSDLTILSITPTTWSNGCMGIARPDQFCTMALVDGWVVSVQAGEHQLTYHTRGGSQALLAHSTDPIWSKEQEVERRLWEETRRRCTATPWSMWNTRTCDSAWRDRQAEQRQREAWRRRWVDIGWTQETPVMPTVDLPDRWRFTDIPSGRWVDPPTAYGFQYTMLGDALFTEVLDFPTGIDDDNLFTISVGEQVLGEFSPGESVSFLDLLGTGVAEFRITDINPLVDPEDPSAFPLKLAFDAEKASFDMMALTEPESIPEGNNIVSIAALGFIGCGLVLKRSRS